MFTISLTNTLPTPPPSIPHNFPSSNQRQIPHLFTSSRKSLKSIFSKSSKHESEPEPPSSSSSSSVKQHEEKDEWLKKLPDKKSPVYSHSLPCIEAWLRNLGFYQSNEDRAVWFVELPNWHAQLSLDVTDFYIRYLKTGPGSLDKDVERRFSYALSREDVENAILGGP